MSHRTDRDRDSGVDDGGVRVRELESDGGNGSVYSVCSVAGSGSKVRQNDRFKK